jgi:pyruvate formate lyase activating enzyme
MQGALELLQGGVWLGFYKITFNMNDGCSRVCLHNSGCNFKCVGCAYKITGAKLGPSPSDRTLEGERIVEILSELRPKRVHFLGGEPTINPELGRITRFAREELGAITKIGHTNGSGRIPEFIDEAAVSIKAYNERLHWMYTGMSNKNVLSNFADAYDRGVKLEVSTVLIPGVIPVEEVERVAEFVARIDRGIKFHITGYIPVPGVPWRSPTPEEMEEAARAARGHLTEVRARRLSVQELAGLRITDPSFRSTRVA